MTPSTNNARTSSEPVSNARQSETNAEPKIAVLTDKFAKGWPANDATKVKNAPMSLALGRRYTTDVHVAQYSSPQPYRLNGDAVGKTPIEMVAVLFDIDGPGHKCEPAWWDSVRGKVFDMLDTEPEDGPTRPVLYQTRGGARLLAKLPRPIRIEDASDAKAWTALTAAWRRYLNRRFELRADDACKSWNWLFRAPHATRDEGGEPENLEVIGDFTSIGTWSNVDLTADDMAQEPDPVHAHSGARYTGYGVVYNLFADRGWVGKELEPGMWSARCPWSHSHTSGKDFDTSTVVFAPGSGQTLGSLHCKHEHCVDRGHDDLLREFTESQLQEAGYGVKREKQQDVKQPTPDSDKAKPPSLTIIRTASSISMQVVDWLWPGRIPAGMLSVFDGDPGLGKSTVTNDIAARLSTGRPMPGEIGKREPADVVLVSFEDHPGAIIRPRLEAAGADLDRVHIWDVAAAPFSLRDSLPQLGAFITEKKAKLVIIDPLMAALPSDLNAHRDQDVRSVLALVSAMAETTGAAVMLVRHLNKASGGAALYRGGGSIGIIGAARVGLLLAKADGEDEAERVLAVTKCNVAKVAPTISLRLVSAPSQMEGVEVARVDWGGNVTVFADELVEEAGERTAISEAVEIVREILQPGPKLAKDVEKEATSAGVSRASIRRAKQRLRVRSERATVTGPWVWALPGAQ